MDTTTTVAANKRRKLTHHQQQPPLIPNLPDHVAHLCLSYVHPSTLYSVSHSWRRLIYTPTFPPFLSLYTLFSSNDAVFHFYNYDPISSTWHSLPPPPLNQLIVRHPSFISRTLPVQSISVCGQLILLAATANNFFPALSHPLIFNPLSKTWAFGPPFAAPRRWCAAGALGSSVYIASGIGSHFSSDVARSVEKWNLKNSPTTTTAAERRNDGDGGSSCDAGSIHQKLDLEKKRMATALRARRSHGGGGWRWEKLKGLKDGRFSREAIDAVGWRGKLCMVNVKGDAAKEGVVYDVEEDTWQNMSGGMVAGWRGPAAAMDEEILYVVDESKGALRKYNHETDTWQDVMESENLIGAQQIVAAGGRVCVVCGGRRGGIVVVDVISESPKMWMVETPPGLEAVAVHVLPRMSI
ncbi:hypothetical protein ACFE04_024056 [Oxalis oulophora]